MTVHVQGPGGETAAIAPRHFDLKWALGRAVLGLLILAVGIGGLAWLTHASIDPNLEQTVAAPPADPAR